MTLTDVLGMIRAAQQELCPDTLELATSTPDTAEPHTPGPDIPGPDASETDLPVPQTP